MSSSETGTILNNSVTTNSEGTLETSKIPRLDMSSVSSLQPLPLGDGAAKSKTPTPSPARSPRTRVGSSTKVTPRSPISKVSSSIPLPVKTQAKAAGQKPVSTTNSVSSKVGGRSSSATIRSCTTPTAKRHSLEIQFMNKKKRLAVLKKELVEKQRPVLELYQNLQQIKKKLEELGKAVCLDEIKVLSYDDKTDNAETSGGDSAQQALSPEILMGMQTSIEEIPKTLMEICQNLLGRRNVIVELLDSVIKSEVDVVDLKDQIETLKSEGVQLQSNLNVIINEHHTKIKEIVENWQTLLKNKQNLDSSAKVEELQEKLRIQERMTDEAKAAILDMQRRLEDKRTGHDRYITDLNSTITSLKEHVQKLEHELEVERKNASEFKSRNNANAQNTKLLRNKIVELENTKKTTETMNTELHKRVKMLQDQLKHKEMQWGKEKEELTKNLKHQENMLQKIAADKQSFETRVEEIEGQRNTLEETLQQKIDTMSKELSEVKSALALASVERDEATQRCLEMEKEIEKIGVMNKENMDSLSIQAKFGREIIVPQPVNPEYSDGMKTELILREYIDRIKRLEIENEELKLEAVLSKTKEIQPDQVKLDEVEIKVDDEDRFEKISIESINDYQKAMAMQHGMVNKYKLLLAESEQKLCQKSREVTKLTGDIRKLQMRQEHIEEVNLRCPPDNLKNLVEDGRKRLSEVMRKLLDSEQKLVHGEHIIEKQSKQMNEMENLLRYRENMAGVMRASRDELLMEKESLTRYSHELRTVLAEVTKEGKMKDRLIKELQDRISLREKQLAKLEQEVTDLEGNLLTTNERRYRLQETLGVKERELQSTKAHLHHLSSDVNTRYEIGMTSQSRINSCNFKSMSQCDMVANHHQSVDHHHCYQQQHQRFDRNCCVHHSDRKIGSKSLIGLSLKQIDFLKARLNYLTQVSLATVKCSRESIPEHKEKLLPEVDDSVANIDKVLDLTAKRYKLLQRQAYDSYAELTSLVKLAISTQKVSDVPT